MALVLKLNPKEIIVITTKSGETITIQAPDGDNSNQALILKADKNTVYITRCLKMKLKVKDE